MSNPKFEKMIQRLIQKTDEGTANWQETSRPNVFALSLADFSVLLRQVDSEEAVGIDVLVEIVNKDGKVIDSVRDVDSVPEFGDPHEWYKRMSDLYKAARRKAMGVDEALDKLLEELDDIPF